MKLLWVDIKLFFYDWYLLHIKKPHCSLCGQIATLKVNKKDWICETCAQIQSELSSEN
ncbi:hypothetical protein KM192_00940 [Pediococcus pentosaceus]|uniref:hypothetical protein n=1 Tax=Pediococcus pentosaceus TaxID=1255 RepID=UPI001C92D14D|nr:hypothetical protein [Pediococcus pentosaceus]MBY4581306.1 hypothetical protein [Pediococcus pentosaceus]